MSKKLKYILTASAGLLLATVQPVYAAGPPQPSPLNNPMAILMIVLMICLLIIIGVMAGILVKLAGFQLRSRKRTAASAKMVVLVAGILLSSSTVFAQDIASTPENINKITGTISGMPPSVFYTLATVLFLELIVILVLLVNIRMLAKARRIALAADPELARAEANRPASSWWTRFNKFKPVEHEAEIDLGHDYDGIRELDNRLPPWWIYGFYATILFAGIYLWRFQVSHTGPSSKQEYERSIAKAESRISEYLKSKGEVVDENTVTYLNSTPDLDAGKVIFGKSCSPCHKELGSGDVGPNLTDNYWLHGGDIKSIFKTIRYGINAMPQWQTAYSNKQIAQVASYIKSLKGTNPPNPKAPQGELYNEDGPAKTNMDSTKTVKTSKSP